MGWGWVRSLSFSRRKKHKHVPENGFRASIHWGMKQEYWGCLNNWCSRGKTCQSAPSIALTTVYMVFFYWEPSTCCRLTSSKHRVKLPKGSKTSKPPSSEPQSNTATYCNRFQLVWLSMRAYWAFWQRLSLQLPMELPLCLSKIPCETFIR